MKIRTKLSLRYTGVTAAIFVLSMLFVYLFSEHTRSDTFFRDLKKEAITKAHLFINNKADAQTMQSIYLNNRNFIDEVEVAIYMPPFKMIYHDAYQIDIVKEDRRMIEEITKEKEIEFYIDHYQAIGMLHTINGNNYIITAAAYDGYGYSNLRSLRDILIAISFTALTILIIVGYIMARSALIPVTAIVKDVEKITASEIYKRLTVVNKDDELGELSIAFNRLLDRLEKAFKSQKMFVSNVSHELRTPMAALVAELELVSLKKRTPQRYEDAVNNALLDAGRIIKLIEGLLDMAKADYAPEQIKMADVRIDELLLDAREMVMKANPEYNIELTFEMEAEDDSVITVFGNSYLLTTAFVNMIDNNCKFSANKASYISISFWQEMSILRFSDNGTGMTESDKNNIFTPFYRGVNKNFAHG
ncbi:MAG: HAMP domain-containing sensor histidine kinase, partial [Bacteroidales bacterium]